jgi:hypothetical protein
MSIHKINEESGFTLAEIIIAISLSFIVIQMGYLALQFSQQQFKKWQICEEVQRKQHIINKILFNDIVQAKKIMILKPTLLKITDKNDSIVTYNYSDSILFRNTRAINTKSTPIVFMCFLDDIPEQFAEPNDLIYQLELNSKDETDETETIFKNIQCVQYYFKITADKQSPILSFAIINLRNKEY